MPHMMVKHFYFFAWETRGSHSPICSQGVPLGEGSAPFPQQKALANIAFTLEFSLQILPGQPVRVAVTFSLWPDLT